MSAFLTPTLENLTPYTPGDIPRKRSILKLNTNENPYPPPTAVVEAIRAASEDLQLYPDPNCLALRKAAADYYDLDPDQILAGNGSDENLFFALRAFCDSERPLAHADVTYGCYSVWCDLMHIPAHHPAGKGPDPRPGPLPRPERDHCHRQPQRPHRAGAAPRGHWGDRGQQPPSCGDRGRGLCGLWSRELRAPPAGV